MTGTWTGTCAKPIPGTDTTGNCTGTGGNGAGTAGTITDVPVTQSASQQSYVRLVAHFDNLIAYVGNDSKYTPDEPDLKTVRLTALSDSLKSNNNAVITTYSALNHARLGRYKAMYDEDTGLVNTAMLVKR